MQPEKIRHRNRTFFDPALLTEKAIGEHYLDHPAAFLLSCCMNARVSPMQTITITPDLEQPKKITKNIPKSTRIVVDGNKTNLKDLLQRTVLWQNKPLTQYGFNILMLLAAHYNSKKMQYAQVFQAFLHAYARHPSHQDLFARITSGYFKNACALDLAYYYQNIVMVRWLLKQYAALGRDVRVDSNTITWIAHSPALNDKNTLKFIIFILSYRDILIPDADHTTMYTHLHLGVHNKPLSYAFIAILQKNVADLKPIFLTHNLIPSLLEALEQEDAVKQLVIKRLVEYYISQNIDLDAFAQACALTTMQSPSENASLQTLIEHSHAKETERNKTLTPQTVGIVNTVKGTLYEAFLQFKDRHPEKYQQFLKELDRQQMTNVRFSHATLSHPNPTLVNLSKIWLQNLELPLWLRHLSAYDVFNIFAQTKPLGVTYELDTGIVTHATGPSAGNSHQQPIELDSNEDTPAKYDAQPPDSAIMTNDQSVLSSPPDDTRCPSQQITHGLDAFRLWSECMRTDLDNQPCPAR